MREYALAAVLVLVAGGAHATTLDVSPDVAVELGGATVQQQDVARDDLSGGAPGSVADLGSLPDGADVVGYHEASPTHQLFVLDVNADLGGTYASAGDVIAYDPGTGLYQIELDISALGIPDGTRVDAFGLASNGDYILSFDVTVDLGGALIASDEDLINYSLGGGFTMLLNGSNVGLDRSLDLDAASELNGNLLVSFDGHGSIGGIDFADEDVLSFDPAASTWAHVYDGSAVHPGQWVGADLVAVPEPGAWSLLGAGMALLAGLARRKRKLALIAALLVPASAGMASDGVLEINQTCAVNTGCFSGDTAGFPVTIASAGSYRLTSNLNVPDENTTAISVQASDLGIDLNNFAIIGPVTCSGAPLACTPGGTGSGIKADNVLTRRAVSVKNGSITGMGDRGVHLGGQSEVTNLRVRECGAVGIYAYSGSTISGSTAHSNQVSGIFTSAGSTVSGNAAYENGSYGVHSSNGSTVSGNTAYSNESRGISAGDGSTVAGNTAYSNGTSGITTGDASTVSGNTAYSNAAHGIAVGNGSTVLGNTVRANTLYGISFAGTVGAYRDNVISGNTAGTVLGTAVQLGKNACNGTTTCP